MSASEPPPGRRSSAAPPQRIDRRVLWQTLVFLACAVAVLVGMLAAAALVRDALTAVREGSIGLGRVLAFTGLLMGNVFLLYSLKYYVSSIAALLGAALLSGPRNGNGNGDGNGIVRIARRVNGNGNGDARGGNGNGELYLDREPFVSIHIATYNERRVLERLLQACAALDYPSYEIVLVDDSTDESRAILDAWEGRPGLKIVRRPTRAGFKGGALAEALRHTDPRAEYVVVYDADSVPFTDSIQRFLPYFYDFNGNGNGVARPRAEVAVVQSYQWHILNKRESWLTEAVRAEYAGSYMVERAFQETVGLMKMVAGTSYMIRAGVLREVGWGHSLTEDWQLTLSLYALGYKVVYTPYAETPAECVGTFSRLSRQRMRWAEGHTYNVRRSFGAVMRSKRLSALEKVEFLFYAAYYLQASLFVGGTLSWLIAEIGLRAHVPEWTALLGWSLLLTNLLALPVMNLSGLVLEEAPPRDLVGVLGALAVSFLLVPFQAWAATRGLFERSEGPWFRTPKTGRITESVRHLRLMRRWLARPRGRSGRPPGPGGPPGPSRCERRPRLAGRTGWTVTIALALAAGAVAVGAIRAPEARADAATSAIYLQNTAGGSPLFITSSPGTSNTVWQTGNTTVVWPWTGTPATTQAAQTIRSTTVFSFTYSSTATQSGNPANTVIRFGYSTSTSCSPLTTIATQTVPLAANASNLTTANFSPTTDVTVPAGSVFCITLTTTVANDFIDLSFGSSSTPTRLNTSQTIFLPERVLLLVGLALMVPVAVRALREARHRC